MASVRVDPTSLVPHSSPYGIGNGTVVPTLGIDIEDGRAWISQYDPGRNGMSMRAYHGFIKSIPLSFNEYSFEIVQPAALEEILNSDEFQNLVSRTAEESDSQWDGSNHWAIFPEEAQVALDELKELIDELPRQEWAVWDAGEWLDPVDVLDTYKITPQTTNEELQKIAEDIDHEAIHGIDGIKYVVEGTYEYLMWERDSI